jgi:hypothetical protein
MSNYSIPFVRTNINSTTTTSLPYVTNPVRIMTALTSCSNTVPVTINLILANKGTDPRTGMITYFYGINQTGNVTFSNFNIPTITTFTKLPTVLLLNTINSLPSSIYISYSNLTTTGFTYTLTGTYTDISYGLPPTTQIYSSFTYFASN